MELPMNMRISFLGVAAQQSQPLVNYDSSALNAASAHNWTAKEDHDLLKFVKDRIHANEGVKWTDIAAALLKTPQECFARYHNVLSGDLNRSEWDHDEKMKLMELVSKYGPFNWVAISAELGTNRPPIQCLRHFQRELNDGHIAHSEWSVEEDLLLNEGIKRFGQGKWQEIAANVPQRSALQCMFRWRKAVQSREDIVVGRWTELEERKLYMLSTALRIPTLESTKHPSDVIVQLFEHGVVVEVDESTDVQDSDGASQTNRWTKVAELIPGKTEEQCREKWTNNMDPTIDSSPFSDPEYLALQILVEHFGEGQWTKIAKYLPGRTDAAVRRNWMKRKKRPLSEI